MDWDPAAEPPRPRYYGYGDIDGVRVSLTGELDTSSGVEGHKRVRLVIRPAEPKRSEGPNPADALRAALNKPQPHAPARPAAPTAPPTPAGEDDDIVEGLPL